MANFECGSNTDSSVYGGSFVPCNVNDHSFTYPVCGISELNFAYKTNKKTTIKLISSHRLRLDLTR